jgi:hypothetical protein
MPLFTTAAAVKAWWTAFELVGGVVLKGTLEPASKEIANWIQQKSGWKDKERKETFREAYQKAETMLIQKIGVSPAYRVFRRIPRQIDTPGQRERLALAVLEGCSDVQQELLEDIQREGKVARKADGDVQNLIKFTRYLRQCLWETETFRPIIEFYTAEEAQEIRKRTLGQLEWLSKAVDSELPAIRVMLVEPEVDFEAQRQAYLKQLEASFEEQESKGLPDLRERSKPTLLRDIYVPLKLHYDGGGEELGDELGQLVEIQTRGED